MCLETPALIAGTVAYCRRVRALLPSPAPDVDLDVAYALPPGRYIRANIAASLDGAAEIGGRSGPLGGSADRQLFLTLRWLADVVLVGAGTLRVEGYGPARVPAERRARRVAAGLGPVPPIAVVSGAMDLDPSSRFFREAEARPIVLTGRRSPARAREALAAVADVIVCGEETVEFGRALAALSARGLDHVLCEGGPAVLGGLCRAGMLDELCLTAAPLLAGPDRLRVTGGSAWSAPFRLSLAHILEEDGMLFLRYRRAGA